MKVDLLGVLFLHFMAEVRYSEYVQTKKDGEPTKFWASKPNTMIKKVAESQALRTAFNISGVYAPEELGVGVDDNGNLRVDTQTVEASIDVEEQNQKLIQQQMDALNQLGLTCEFKGGYVKVVGKTFGKTDHLKTLGYKFIPDKQIWVKKLS